jgi:lipopolysaccharide/colanic/teichoic acid biosynthesis glycosyltransferase
MSTFSPLLDEELCVQEPARAPSVVSRGPQRIYTTTASTSCCSDWSLSASKRVLDCAVSVLVLGIFAIPMLAIGLLIRLTSEGPAFFAQKRVGRAGRLFTIYKFRSMEVCGTSRPGFGLTKSGDSRVTALGYWLRKFKLDELPQFYNILRGDMSMVGPRPKLPQFAEDLNLLYRPGITGAASLAFRREEEILSRVAESEIEAFYHQRIKPIKARIDSRYMNRATLLSDLKVIASTFFGSVMPARAPEMTRKQTAKAETSMPSHVSRMASIDAQRVS